MNKIDFLKYSTFPLDSNTLDFMQEMINTVSKMSAVCGEKVIVYGCEKQGSYIGDGLVIIDGELLEFKGDSQVDTVYIEEVKEEVICQEEAMQDLYIKRLVKFGYGDGTNNYRWSEFKRLDNIPQLMQKVTALQSGKTDTGHKHEISDITSLPDKIVPKGLIAMWSGTTPPEGWTLCNKGYIYQGVYVPNLQGRFIVGFVGGSGAVSVAEEIKSTMLDYQGIGYTAGQAKVTLTEYEMPRHSHSFQAPLVAGEHPGRGSGYDRPNSLNNGTTGFAGGGQAHENRPPYYVLAYIIKI